MNKLLQAREQIYNHLQASSAMQSRFRDPQQEDAYAVYYTSMYLIQNIWEVILTHMQTDFSNYPMKTYSEFWGVMRVIFIQQDAIRELHSAVVGKQAQDPVTSKLERNTRKAQSVFRSSLQPVRRVAPQRAFMGRGFWA